MAIRNIAFVCLCVLGLASCGDSDLERGVSGAAAGALVLGPLGALAGATAGVFCDDVGVDDCE